jgi:hypothetical protein
VQVEQDQLAQQLLAFRCRRVAQEVFDGRPAARLPGRLEGVTRPVDALLL